MLIDIDNYSNYLKYPLAANSKGLLGNILFPYKRIYSITIQSYKLESFYIRSILLKGNYIQLQFSSTSNTQLLTCQICQNSQISMLLNSVGTISGNMYYSPQLYKDIRNILHQIGTANLSDINPDILCIHIDCIIPFVNRSYQKLQINDYHITADSILKFTNNVQCKVQANTTSINLFGDCPLTQNSVSTNKITKLTIKNTDDITSIDCTDKQLLIKSSALSDIRVITDNHTIFIEGDKHD